MSKIDLPSVEEAESFEAPGAATAIAEPETTATRRYDALATLADNGLEPLDLAANLRGRIRQLEEWGRQGTLPETTARAAADRLRQQLAELDGTSSVTIAAAALLSAAADKVAHDKANLARAQAEEGRRRWSYYVSLLQSNSDQVPELIAEFCKNEGIELKQLQSDVGAIEAAKEQYGYLEAEADVRTTYNAATERVKQLERQFELDMKDAKRMQQEAMGKLFAAGSAVRELSTLRLTHPHLFDDANPPRLLVWEG